MMQLQDLPSDLPVEIRQWATMLRKVAEATGETTASALAVKVNCAQATLSRYLQGQRPQAAFGSVVPRLLELAEKQGRNTFNLDDLRAAAEKAALAAGNTARPPTSRAEPTRPPQQAIHQSDRKPERDVTSTVVHTATSKVSTGSVHEQPHMTDDDVPSPPASSQRPPNAPVWRRRRNYTKKLAIAIAGAALLIGAAAWTLSPSRDTPGSAESAMPGQVAGSVPTVPSSSSAATSIDAKQSDGKRCAVVVAATSPVWVHIGDDRPLKWKAKDDRIRLIDLPVHDTGDGAYQAVLVPKDSPTGHGWMRLDDLAPTSCASSS